jgi:Ribosomal protein S1
VFLDRIENALGEAVLSRDKARREESWGKLEKAFNNNEKGHGVIFNQVKGGFTVDLDGAWPSCRARRSISARSATSRR